MPLSAMLIVSLVVGLVAGTLIKLLFNKITGKRAFDSAHLDEFFGIIIVCAVITFIVFAVGSCESCLNSPVPPIH